MSDNMSNLKNVLIAGCSWVQRMGEHTVNEVYDGVSFKYASFGGMGLWKIKQVLECMSARLTVSPQHHWNDGVNCDLNDYDYVIVQLPCPVRNTIDGVDTTERICALVDSFDEIGKEAALKKNIDEYKEKIEQINTLHNNIIFFWYNLIGVPFKHPINYGDELIKDMEKFLENYNLIHLSLEGKAGYHIKEEHCDDEEFVKHWYKSWPPDLNTSYKKHLYMSAVPKTLVFDGHPNQQADLLALKKIYDYVIEN